MSRRKRAGFVLALTSALVGGVGLLVHRRWHKLWFIPEPPSRGMAQGSCEPAGVVPRLHVLFVGHSLVNQTMPRMASAIAAALGVELTYDVQLIDGGSLEVNWNHAEEATGVNAREALGTGAYDTMVLTEAVNLDDHLRWSDPPGHALRWYLLARAARPDARLFFYETWHHRSEPRHASGLPVLPSRLSWREQLDADLGKWEHIVDAATREAMRSAPDAAPLDVHIVPGGQALAALVDAVRAGEVPGVAREVELFTDGVHLSDLGNYFIALVQVATLTHVDLTGAPHQVPRADGELVSVPPD
ncbi:MAG: hypothetical protein KC668_12650, partial [Myxococcales bacterium]|nr:hypothetical protein [Myxococcales bacterium]